MTTTISLVDHRSRHRTLQIPVLLLSLATFSWFIPISKTTSVAFRIPALISATNCLGRLQHSNDSRIRIGVSAMGMESTSDGSNHADCDFPYVLKERNPYDVHVYYNGPLEKAAALELRDKMMTKFGDWMRFYPPHDVPIGPHPLPMWEADFGSYDNRTKWREVKDFILENNEHDQSLSILIHPHSTDGDYADHTKNAFWVGKVLDLKIQGWK